MNYTVLISLLALVFAVYSFFSSRSKDNTQQLTTVIVKLDSIGQTCADIKAEMNSIKIDQKADHDRLVIVETRLDAAWTRLDSMEGDLK